ncbi:MAG: class I SAM-dependent methyltransferase [Phycisphaerales bacterium]|nr:class I SAM-dependent methyltransferase [Phycisphaerales bacterium]
MTTDPTPTVLDARREQERAKYVALAAKPGSTYGSTNHGKLAVPIIQKFNPRFIVDFGCGRNGLVRDLRRLGIDGLGVDFAFPDADLVRPMHKTALHAAVAEVVTSFDALEHLLPEDVDAVLAEMRRVAKPRGHFVFSICTRPSKTTVAGEGLHPTVRPLDWWLDRIGRVATVINPRAERRFIVGRFKGGSDGGCCGA